MTGLAPLGSTLRILRPHPNVYAFYDGRIDGVRAYSTEPNWLDDGAYALGIASFAVVDGHEALIYDTHISLTHARAIRRALEEAGVTSMRVLLSHWHDDHVAGNEVFADCEIIAHALTAAALIAHKDELEHGTPPIHPLIMPHLTYEGPLDLTVGRLEVELRPAEIHSHDGVLLGLPDHGVLLVGDTLEDTVTYVAEPDRLEVHLAELDRVASWGYRRLLPNHGDPGIIASGGYGPELITATKLYVEKLIRARTDDALAGQDLKTFAAEALATGGVHYFAPYEEVHARNLKVVRGD
ncbi:MAG: beta-lactamase protein [Xanthobacteraceae bacterium]|jgi:glyoxylase-like metal-dependent hydrolase (beta-lactamase superfamily II)|nr:beta-lactamase protein [Xanthobacteraceae bacterium]